MPNTGSERVFYDMKEYHSALDEFKKAITRYPKNHKVPAAFFKRGLTYLRLDNPRGAALEFEKLLDDFPSHPLTKKAREQVRSLKLPGNSLRKQSAVFCPPSISARGSILF